MPEQLSGLTPQITLSGPQIGPGMGYSGASGGGLAGTGQQGPGGVPFGLPGGLGLDQLQALLGGGGDQGASAAFGDLTSGLGAGSFGQQVGGLGAGSVGQLAGAGGGAGAGGIAAGQTGQQGPATGSVDPFSILAKILGLAKTATGLFPGQGQTATASPTGELTGAGKPGLDQVPTASPNLVSDVAGGQFVPPEGYQGPLGADLAGKPGLPPGDIQLLNQFLGGNSSNPFGPTGGAPFTPLTDYSPEGIQKFLQSLATSAPGSASIEVPSGLSGAGGGISGAGTPAGTPQGAFGAGNVASGFGGLQGLLGLIQSAQSGNVPGVLSGAQGLYQGATGLAGASPIASTIATQFPQLASALVEAAGTGAAGVGAGTAAGAGAAAGAEATSAAVSAALSGLGAAAAPIIMAITSFLSNQDEVNAMRSWATLGKPITQLHEQEAAAIPAANQLFAGGIPNDPQSLLRAITGGANALYTAYEAPQGPGGPLTAADYFKRVNDPAQQAQMQAQQQQLMGNEFSAIQRAHDMGITNQQLGGLNVNPLWSQGMLSGLDPGTGYGSAAAQAAPWFFGPQGGDSGQLQAAGGPLMSMLAQLNPALYTQIGGYVPPSPVTATVGGEPLASVPGSSPAQQYADWQAQQEAQQFLQSGAVNV